ncbi:MAG: glutathione S-transferase [Gammaproteobacteria bacterium]|nr:MAG: glutathione S-transferase [Gammaproteobacteria bacterium]
MISIHHLTNSRSQRIIWLLEELDVEYTIIFHERDKKTRQAADSLHQVHSLGKAPVLIDETLSLAETGAIVDYLLETYGKDKLVIATGYPARTDYLYWKNFAEASLMPYLAMTKLFSRIEQGTPFIVRPIAKLVIKKINKEYLHANLVTEVNLIERHLSEHQWFAGDQFTAADILMGFMLDALCGKFITKTSHPNSCNFVEEIKARPAYQRAKEKGKWSEKEFNLYWNHLRIGS